MKLIEFFKDLDIFSETVQFNAIRQRLKNRTIEGACLTISIFILTFIYFVYQSYRYFDGQMDPKFSQTIFNTLNSVSSNELKIQNQVTKVSEGLVVQSESTYSSPFSQTINSQTFDRKSIQQTIGYQFLSQVTFSIDEQITYFTIQYPLFAEVLALCNSILALLLVTGTFCRKLAQNLIRRNIFFILMKDFFSGSYLHILQHNKIVAFNEQIVENKNFKEEQPFENQSDEENKQNIILPFSITKPSKAVTQLQQLNNNNNNMNNPKQDPVKEDSGFTIKQAEEFLESLRTNEDKIMKKEITLDKQTIFQMSPNQLKIHEKLIDYESEQEQIPSIFSSKSQQQQFQLQVKDINYELLKGVPQTPQCQNILMKSDQPDYIQFKESEKKINKNSISQINKSFQILNDKSLQQKLEKMLFKTKIFKKQEFLQSKGLKQKIINEFDQQIDDSLDFYTFYKEILQLKKAIMILLNKEQYAALQVIGIDIEKINKSFENNVITKKKKKRMLATSKNSMKYSNQKNCNNIILTVF
ncbi:hypothetical protein ABPG74_007728 [Tetrahymena malaccensis]